MKRKYIVRVLTAILLLTAAASATPDTRFADDFIEFWTDMKDNYAYFDKKHTDWHKVKTMYLPRAQAARDREELITIFEQACEELYDHHISLNINLKSSTRLVPTGLDIWAEWVGDKAMITEVRRDFSADKAGIKAGMEIISINEVPVAQAVNNRIGKCITKPDTEARNYALRQLLAGNYITQRVIKVKQDGKVSILKPDEAAGNLTDNHRYPSLLDTRIIDNTGYIRFNNSLGETDAIRAFDSALLQLRHTSGLIIDLRETPSGGNSVVARGVMGRFISRDMPYQKHVLPGEEKASGIKRSWLEIVSPRGPFTYQGRVVVLVNHWTGSMGEGIAIGFDALGRTETVGTKMAGLNGAISGFRSAKTKIPYSFPTEQLYHVNGTPREHFIPRHLIDPADPKYRHIEDPVLAEGLSMIKKR